MADTPQDAERQMELELIRVLQENESLKDELSRSRAENRQLRRLTSGQSELPAADAAASGNAILVQVSARLQGLEPSDWRRLTPYISSDLQHVHDVDREFDPAHPALSAGHLSGGSAVTPRSTSRALRRGPYTSLHNSNNNGAASGSPSSLLECVLQSLDDYQSQSAKLNCVTDAVACDASP